VPKIYRSYILLTGGGGGGYRLTIVKNKNVLSGASFLVYPLQVGEWCQFKTTKSLWYLLACRLECIAAPTMNDIAG